MADAGIIERPLDGASLRTLIIPDARIPGNDPEHWENHSLFSDGTYYNVFDAPRGTRQQYRRLKLFADVV